MSKIDLDFSGINVLIIGDIMIDRYMIGEILRMSPEDPDIPVLENITIENRLGGAANVALNIKALGANPYLCGVLGQDENTNIFRNALNKNELTDELIVESPNRLTTVKTRVIAQKQLLRVDREDTKDITEEIVNDIIDRIENTLSMIHIDMIIFQDYNKGVLNPNLIEKVTAIAKRDHILTAVDPKKANFFNFKNLDIFKPNRREVEDQLGKIEEITPSNIKLFSDKIRAKNGAKSIFITLSEHGIFYDNGVEYGILPIYEGDIVDVSGAGDSVLSILCLSTIKNYPIEEVVSLGNRVGAYVCAYSGVKTVDLSSIKSQLRHIG